MSWVLRIVRRVVLGLVAFLILLAGAGFVYERVQRAATRRAFPPPGRMVDIGGHQLHIACEGAGSPTVILEAGQGALGSLTWTAIKSQVAEFVRVCSYDRAGLLWSDPGPTPRVSTTIAAELQALLQEADESGPYVLVGHSLGGIHIRNFAELEPSEVGGFVFVDASHPDQLSRLPPTATGTPPALVQSVVKFLNGVGLFRFISVGAPVDLGDEANEIVSRFRPASNRGLFAEATVTAQSLASVPEDQDFGDIPIKVLTGGRRLPFVSEEVFAAALPLWIDMHRELATLSTAGSHEVVSDATHYIHVDRPDVVVDAIRQVVAEARAAEQDGPD